MGPEKQKFVVLELYGSSYFGAKRRLKVEEIKHYSEGVKKIRRGQKPKEIIQ